MFIQSFGYIGRPIDEIEKLLPDVVLHLGGWGEGSYRDGEALRMRIGVAGEQSLVAKTVSLRTGPPVKIAETIRLPVTWEATGTPGLFPRMSADLVVARLDEHLTQIKFEGSYEPPLGAVGEVLDRAVLHRVAEMSVKDLVDRIIQAFY